MQELITQGTHQPFPIWEYRGNASEGAEVDMTYRLFKGSMELHTQSNAANLQSTRRYTHTSSSSGGAVSWQLQQDVRGNITRIQQNNRTEEFAYDAWSQLTQYDGFNRKVNITYDNFGNITEKSDFARYVYDPTKIHQLVGLEDVTNQTVDAYFNPLTAEIRTLKESQLIQFNTFHAPSVISEGTSTLTQFTYGPNREPKSNSSEIQFTGFNLNDPFGVRTLITDRAFSKQWESRKHRRITVGGFENVTSEEVQYISGPDGSICALAIRPESEQNYSIYPVLTNHQGSITHILSSYNFNSSNQNYSIIEERSYDPWGLPRDPETFESLTIAEIEERGLFKLTARWTFYEICHKPSRWKSIIDMRHTLIVGNLAPIVGNLVEVGQWMSGQASGMNPQDFYSNGVVYQFYMQYSGLQNFFYPTTFTNQLQNFFYSPRVIINH